MLIMHSNKAYFQLDYEQTCVNFTVERWFPVANMSRYLPIRVYDYYAPGKKKILCPGFILYKKYHCLHFIICLHVVVD